MSNPVRQKRPAANSAVAVTEVPTAILTSPKIVEKPLSWFKPYKQNPRDNKDAVASVAESIKSFGFLVPIVADSNGEIAAGHTRHLAAIKLKLKSAPVIIADHLTQQQLQAFRLIDNKVSELAVWDYDLLAGEIAQLQSAGVELTQYGWTQEEIDCLSQMVGEDCLAEVQAGKEADGVNVAHKDARTGSSTISGDSMSVRVAVGGFNFFIPKTHYEEWASNIRKAHNFDNDAVVMWIATQLGLVDGHEEHQRAVKERRGAAHDAAEEVKAQQREAQQTQQKAAAPTGGRRGVVQRSRVKQ